MQGRSAQQVAVVGGGTMGLGIAYVAATAGLRNWIVEASPARRETLREELQRVLAVGRERGRITEQQATDAMADTKIIESVADLPTGLDVIVESVPEQRDLKRQVLATALERDPVVLATNTSSLSVDDLADGLADPSRVLGLHFFNPVWSLDLVEVVRGAKTSADTIESALAYVAAIGKQSAVVADTPGFATSRLDLIAALESMRMVEQGVGEPADIDRAVHLAYRHPVGPLRLSDIVGLDVRLDIARQLESSLGERFSPPQILIDLVAQGHLGKKTGRGFYEWDPA